MSVNTELKTNPDAVTHGVIPYVQVEGAATAVDFYKKAFGAVERSRTPGQDGKLMNAQLEINGGLLMVMDAMPERGFAHQPSHSFTMQLIVPDGQGWFDRAVAAGCTVQNLAQWRSPDVRARRRCEGRAGCGQRSGPR